MNHESATHVSEQSFVSLVRENKVPHPPQRAFTPTKWTNAFRSIATPTLEDVRLHESGLYFFRQLAEARDQHSRVPNLGLPSSEHVRLVTAAVNASAYVDQRYTELRRSDAQLSGNPGHVFGPVLQAYNSDLASRTVQLIDAIRHILPEIARQGDGESLRLSDDEIMSTVVTELNLGRMYEALGTGWQECLWADYWIEPFPPEDPIADLLFPGDFAKDSVRAIGDFRRDSLLTEFGIHAAALWHRLPRPWREVLSSKLVVRRVMWKNGIAVPVLGKQGSLGPIPPTTFVSRGVAEEPYFRPLLNVPLPNLGNLTLGELLNVWEMMATLGKVLESRVPKVPIKTVHDALRWAPLTSIRDVEKILSEALEITPEQAHVATNLFILPFEARSDPWTQPWVRVGDDWMTPLFNAVENTNLIRCLERWLELGGISLHTRGKHFEESLRGELREAIELPDSSVTEKSVRVRTSDGFEEIDLVIRIGNTVLVGECKCSLYPVGSHGYYTYEQTLKQGAEQASRKAEFCKQHVEAFLRAADIESVRTEHLVILPVVITNVPHGTAQQFNGVPVADLYILSRYLDGGRNYFRRATFGQSGINSGEPTRFYDSVEEAPFAIERYLADPPQLQEPRSWLRLVHGDWIPSEMLDRPLMAVRYQVVPETPPPEALDFLSSHDV